jgi:hypothetical protein
VPVVDAVRAASMGWPRAGFAGDESVAGGPVGRIAAVWDAREAEPTVSGHPLVAAMRPTEMITVR